MSVELRGYLVSCGEPISDRDWWVMAEGMAEGITLANVAWMRGRPLDSLDLATLGVRYRPAVPLESVLPHPKDPHAPLRRKHQVCRLAPDVVHLREGSCMDLAAFVAARERLRGARTRVQILIDPTTQDAHAVALIRGRVWDPATLPRARS